MTLNFDDPINRRVTDSAKWGQYGDDVLPLWVADMDFRSPEPVIEALKARADEGVFGYVADSPELKAVMQERLRTRHQFTITPDDIIFLPGLVVALNAAARTFGSPRDGISMLTPVYHPFITAVANAGRALHDTPLTQTQDGAIIRYEIDFDAFERSIQPDTKLFMFCNPHNPVGRVYTRAELERIAEICLRHDLVILSDEIHCDLVLDGEHISIASLSPEVAARTITLFAPSKTFNVPGLGCGMAVTTSADLNARLCATTAGIVPHVNIMGYTAALAAYQHGQPWLDALLPYLRANRDAVVAYVREHLPGAAVTNPEGTYLAWLDLRGLGLTENTCAFLTREAKVALNDGAAFGRGGEGFVRLNFGCTRATLMEALDRIRAALDRAGALA